jgi:NOL1/NOP2/fmu family ribosome biogenesis protein
LCGLITSIEISLNLQKRMEIELDTYKKMYKLTVEIDKEVNCIFDINENVKMKLLETVEKKYIEYQSIISTSNIVTSVIVLNEDEFEKVYVGNDVEKNRVDVTEEEAEKKNQLILAKIVNESQYMFPFLHNATGRND